MVVESKFEPEIAVILICTIRYGGNQGYIRLSFTALRILHTNSMRLVLSAFRGPDRAVGSTNPNNLNEGIPHEWETTLSRQWENYFSNVTGKIIVVMAQRTLARARSGVEITSSGGFA